MNCRLCTDKAFTLIEMLFAVLILVCLMAIVMVQIGKTDLSAKISADTINIQKINEQVEKWYFNNGYWPANDLKGISENKKYFPEGIPICPVDGTRYELDEKKHRVLPHEHEVK